MIARAIDKIKKEIQETAIASGRLPEDITLIAVTKTRTIDEMQEVQNLGLIDFGENRVQELEGKYDKFDDQVNWHLIGHLQRNKVKNIIDKVKLIHSVDSLRLAKMINKEAAKHQIVAKILIQVNVANEDTKFGLHVDEVLPLLKKISVFKNIQVRGLMTMAPYTLVPEESRKHFQKLKKLSVDIDNQKIDNIFMEELSMGMTNDYLVAIEEGATIIRVGTGIFGDREYNN